MPLLLSADDFRLDTATCEIRYSEAYLLFDRTGAIIQDVRRLFTDVRIINPTPIQTTFQAKEGVCALELLQSRFSVQRPDSSLEKFGVHCKHFFETTTSQLEVNMITRVGLRLLFRKKLKEVSEARNILSSLQLLNLEQKKRFGASEQLDELIIRWEGEQIGATSSRPE